MEGSRRAGKVAGEPGALDLGFTPAMTLVRDLVVALTHVCVCGRGGCGW